MSESKQGPARDKGGWGVPHLHCSGGSTWSIAENILLCELFIFISANISRLQIKDLISKITAALIAEIVKNIFIFQFKV